MLTLLLPLQWRSSSSCSFVAVFPFVFVCLCVCVTRTPRSTGASWTRTQGTPRCVPLPVPCFPRCRHVALDALGAGFFFEATCLRQADTIGGKEHGYFCIHFARGMCAKGVDCTYYHRVPTAEDDALIDRLHDVFGRERHSTHRDDMGGGVGHLCTCVSPTHPAAPVLPLAWVCILRPCPATLGTDTAPAPVLFPSPSTPAAPPTCIIRPLCVCLSAKCDVCPPPPPRHPLLCGDGVPCGCSGVLCLRLSHLVRGWPQGPTATRCARNNAGTRTGTTSTKGAHTPQQHKRSGARSGTKEGSQETRGRPLSRTLLVSRKSERGRGKPDRLPCTAGMVPGKPLHEQASFVCCTFRPPPPPEYPSPQPSPPLKHGVPDGSPAGGCTHASSRSSGGGRECV